MKSMMYGCAAALALVLTLAILRGPADPTRAAPLEVLVQPEAAAQLEAQRLAAQTEQARIAAETEAVEQRERTLRLLILAGAVAVCGAAWSVLGLARGRGTTYVLLPGSREFDAALLDVGGRWDRGVPVDRQGQTIRYLEVAEE